MNVGAASGDVPTRGGGGVVRGAAVPLGQHEPGSEEWNDARRFRLGGSEVAAVLGLSPWQSRLSLWLQKKGVITADFDDDPDQEWGRRIEPVIAAKFIEDHPGNWQANPGLFKSTVRTWQLANPDGLDLSVRDGLFEVKRARRVDMWGESGTDDIPVYYRCQVLQYLDVFELEFAWVPALVNHSDYRVYLLERDAAAETDIEILREAGEQFVTDLINDRMPDIDRHAATYRAIREMHPDIAPGEVEIDPELAGDYLAAYLAEKDAKADKDHAAAQITAELGTFRDAMVDGARFAYRTHRAGGTPFLQADRKRVGQLSHPRTVREAIGA